MHQELNSHHPRNRCPLRNCGSTQNLPVATAVKNPHADGDIDSTEDRDLPKGNLKAKPVSLLNGRKVITEICGFEHNTREAKEVRPPVF
jgi:hypothetical protein